MRGSLVVCFLLVTLARGHEGDEGRQKRLWPSRCYPGSHCFPGQEELEIFRDSLSDSGSVIVPSDAEYPTVVTSTNLRWTRNPGVVVKAKTVADVQKTVLFARHFYLNLVYSTSGLDYTGRGHYDGSLKLDLSDLKEVTTSNLNIIQGATVTAQPGATWGEVYGKVEGKSIPWTLAGGTPSQDSLDMFVLTGGLSPISRSLGLATDNLRSVTMVLANGNLAVVTSTQVTVTDQDGEIKTYEDPELFKAIKGGGLGFGVPVSFTFDLTQAVNIYSSVTSDYKIMDNNVIVGRGTLRTILGQMSALPVQWGGYVSVDGSPDPNFATDRGKMKYHLLSYGQWDFNSQFNQNSAINNLRNLNSQNGAIPNVNTRASLANYRTEVDESEQHFTQKDNSYVFNALLGNDVISNTTKLDELVELMMDVVNAPTTDSNWRCVLRLAGGKVGQPNRDSFVNGKLRSALFSATCALTWAEGVTREDYFVSQALDFQHRLRAVSNGGVDGFFASEDIDDWKTALFGANYYKLLDIKKRYDIDNYLWAHNAIASDFELNCRGIRCPHHH